jgi:two-component system, cell cycle sensor histidine kinase and response regulator CckA
LARHTPDGDSAEDRGIAHALRVSGMALGVERVSVWCFERGDTALVCKGLFVSSTHSYTTQEESVDCATIPAYLAGLRERRVVAARDARTHHVTRELAEAYLIPRGITSLLDAPIIHGGQVVGVVCHEHVGEPREFAQHEIDFAGNVADIIALLMEQSARVAAERALRAQEERSLRAAKLEATSRLARTAAHDFNNVLTSVLAFADQLATSSDPDVRNKAKAIIDAAEIGARISRELLVLGRDAPAAPRRVLVKDVLQSVVGLARSQYGSRLTVDTQIAAPGAEVVADPSQLERIVLNLCSNAAEAMGGAGVLTVAVRPPHRHETRARGYVAIEVSDQGPGLSPQVLAHLYEPYFTTKPSGHGLGLASVHGIVKQLQGKIAAENRNTGGARFVVLLPVAS